MPVFLLPDVVSMTNAYLEEPFESVLCIIFNTGCHDWIVSTRSEAASKSNNYCLVYGGTRNENGGF
jgi:hypothetical protein